jgi:glycosyltransferase involved in cell wall biosynthesis
MFSRLMTQPAEWPRVALVTPVLNSGKYLEATIQSVLSQDYPNLEYYIVDGGSTDDTVDVIRKYEDRISGWTSEPDRGMYDALNKGFARTTGEIMGWISATDMLHLGGLRVVGSIFSQLPKVEWITGRPTQFSEEGMITAVGGIPHWTRTRFLAGFNRYIQQESTFWRRSLWNKAGGFLDSSLRMAGDFELWLRFFRHASLYSVDTIIGGFRVHEASLGLQRLGECHQLHDKMIRRELANSGNGFGVRLFRGVSGGIKRTPGLRYLWWRLVEQIVPFIPGPDWSPTIRFQSDRGWNCK